MDRETDHNRIRKHLQPDPNRRKVALSTCQITKASEDVKHALDEMLHTYKYITCDNCDINAVCIYAFDPYNTDGDCLGMK